MAAFDCGYVMVGKKQKAGVSDPAGDIVAGEGLRGNDNGLTLKWAEEDILDSTGGRGTVGFGSTGAAAWERIGEVDKSGQFSPRRCARQAELRRSPPMSVLPSCACGVLDGMAKLKAE